jgi:uncharacterized membrane protein YqhA
MLLIYRFVADFVALAMELTRLDWRDAIAGVLDLVAIYLTINLVLIVTFYIYGSFVRRISSNHFRYLPGFLVQETLLAFLQKLWGIITAIAALEAPTWYLDIGRLEHYPRVGWVMAFPLMFIAGMALFAMAHRLGRDLNNRSS